jgi:hypothetical protein
MKSYKHFLLLSIFIVLIISACGKGSNNEPEQDLGCAVSKTYKRGPLTVELCLDKEILTIAETLNLSIEAVIEEGYELKLPSYGEGADFGGFGLLDYKTPPERLGENGRIIYTRSYVLEPFLSGEYYIPALKFRFNGDGEGETHELVTEEFKITVNSILPEDYDELELKDIAGPVLPPGPRKGVLIGFAVAALAVLAGLWFGIRYLRGRESVSGEIVVPPHERAYAELQALLAQDLVERGLIKEFYTGVSAVLRQYIEDRYGLNAPERTTEEFLMELGEDDILMEEQKQLLKEFLTHCDLVKFAEFKPVSADVRRTFETCRDFVLAEVKDAV